jgi:hypothetical protein
MYTWKLLLLVIILNLSSYMLGVTCVSQNGTWVFSFGSVVNIAVLISEGKKKKMA